MAAPSCLPPLLLLIGSRSLVPAPGDTARAAAAGGGGEVSGWMVDSGSTISDSNLDSELLTMNTDMEVIDPESQVELEEKTRLINQVLELQHTLEELSARVDAVKEENLKLKSENQVLGQYIENLMSASSVFQTTDTKGKRK
ncbi:short coiled-coil protein isoform X1 [Amblyraja radiata]|uniref:short coiled-coil protein isoform X1 n=2 Tax=Amblyraja radiata TaxID=386614 RepID=UPI001402C284|nr:short coiled-coil protein isoform X1 [Amblyraja radiata]XP_032905169.1 short coiled-coil protein isoform X1 [Amblyraja radiata]